jgi:hypothetical protein
MSLQAHGEHLELKSHISKAVSFPGASKCRLGLTELGDQSLARKENLLFSSPGTSGYC